MIDYPALSDTELQRLFVEGDAEAGNALAMRYTKLVRICIRPYFLAGGDNEDLLQEGMIGLLSAMRGFDPAEETSFKTYAELCIKRRIISAAKSASRQKHAPLNDGVSLEEILSDEAQTALFPSEQLLARSTEDQVLDAERKSDFFNTYMQCLSKFETEVLTYYLDGLSYAELSQRCGRSVKSVDNAVQRIRKKLAQLNLGEFS